MSVDTVESARLSPLTFTCIHAELSAALATVAMAVPKSVRSPRVAGVLIDGTGDTLTLATTDGKTYVETHVSGSAPATGQLLVSHRELVAALKALAPTRQESEGRPVQIIANEPHRVRIVIGGRSAWVSRFAPGAFPHFVDRLPIVAEMDADEFSAACLKVLVAAGTDKFGRGINGVMFEISDGSLLMAAMDGMRIALARIDAAASPAESIELVVDRKVLSAIIERLPAGELKIGWGSRAGDPEMSLRCGDLSVRLVLRGTAFPEYTGRLPVAPAGAIIVGRKGLLTAARRAARISAAVSGEPVVTLKISGKTVSVVPGPTAGGRRIVAPAIGVDPRRITDGARLGFKGALLIEALESFETDSVVVHLADPASADGMFVLTEAIDDVSNRWAYRHFVEPAEVAEGLRSAYTETPQFAFTCDWPALVQALDLIDADIDTKVMLPSSTTVLVEPMDGEVKLSGSAAGALISARVAAELQADAIATRIDRAQLRGVLAAVAIDRTQSELTTLKVTIAAADSRSPIVHVDGYAVPLTAVDDDAPLWNPPALPTLAEVDQSALAAATARVVPALDATSHRPMAHSVKLAVAGDSVNISATDLSQLASVCVPASETVVTKETAPGAWVNHALLTRIVRQLGAGPIQLGWGRVGRQTLVSFASRSAAVIAPTTMEDSRSLDAMVPVTAPVRITVDRRVLLAEVKGAVGLLKARGIKRSERELSLRLSSDGLTVTPVLDQPFAEAKPLIEAEVQGVDAPRWVLVRSRSLLCALTNFSETQVTLHVHEDARRIVVTSEPSGLDERWAFRHMFTLKPFEAWASAEPEAVSESTTDRMDGDDVDWRARAKAAEQHAALLASSLSELAGLSYEVDCLIAGLTDDVHGSVPLPKEGLQASMASLAGISDTLARAAAGYAGARGDDMVYPTVMDDLQAHGWEPLPDRDLDGTIPPFSSTEELVAANGRGRGYRRGWRRNHQTLVLWFTSPTSLAYGHATRVGRLARTDDVRAVITSSSDEATEH